MDRRALLKGSAGLAVAPAAVSELIRHGFMATLGRRDRVGEWLDTADRYGADYMSLGAGEMQAKIAKGLVVLQQHLERPELWGVAARMLTVYGKTLPSNDGTKGAVEWYRLASIAADRSGNDQVRVWVRGRAALALAYEGASLRFAEEAARCRLTTSRHWVVV